MPWISGISDGAGNMIKRKKPQQDGAGRKTISELAPMALALAAALLLVLAAGGCIGTPGAHKRMAKAAAASGAQVRRHSRLFHRI